MRRGRGRGLALYPLPRAAGAPSSRLGSTAAGPVGGRRRGRHLTGAAHPAPLPPRMGPGTTSAAPLPPPPRTRVYAGCALRSDTAAALAGAGNGCAEEEKAAKLRPSPAGGSRGPPGAGTRDRVSTAVGLPPPRRGGGLSVPELVGAKPPALLRRGWLLCNLNKKELLPREVTYQRRVKTKVKASGQNVVPSSHLCEGDNPFLRRGHTGPSSTSHLFSCSRAACLRWKCFEQRFVYFCPESFSSVNAVAKGRTFVSSLNFQNVAKIIEIK